MTMRVLVLALAAALPGGAQSVSSSLDAYLTNLARQCWQRRAAQMARIRTPADVAARQAYIRERILAEIGGFPEKTPLNARVTGTLERDGYRVEKVVYESQPRYYVTANVYVPKSGSPPYAAVLGTAGHSADGKAYENYQRVWIALARRGFLVLAFDPMGQGERSEYLDAAGKPLGGGSGTAEHTMAGTQCLLTGTNFARWEIWDGIRGIDYLLERGDVDARRVAVAGNSGGGTQTAYLAALEPRLAAAAPSCYLTSWEKLWAGQGPQDAEQDFAGFLRDGLDFPDFLIPFAPRPIQMSTAVRDFFPIDGARATYAEARRIFDILGAGDRMGYFEYDDSHGWSQPRREATYRWLEKWLHGRDDDGREPQITVDPARDLWATPSGQVATSLEGETVQSMNLALAGKLYAARKLPVTRETVARLLAVDKGVPLACSYQLEVPRGGPRRKPAVIALGGMENPPRDSIVLTLEPRGWNLDRKRAFSTLMRALLVGKTLAGIQVTDTLAAFELLRARRDVSPKQISVYGRGLAGVVARYAAFLEPRLHARIEGRQPTYMEIARMKRHEGLETLVVPGVLAHFDLPDLK